MNTGGLPTDDSSVTVVTLPQVYDFAMAAVAAPLVGEESGAESTTVAQETTTTGGCSVFSSSLTITIVSLIAAAALYSAPADY